MIKRESKNESLIGSGKKPLAEVSPPEVVVEEPRRQDLSSLARIARAMSSEYGERSMVYLKEDPMYTKVRRYVSTSNRALDWICSGIADGTGGLPVGRIVELFGDPSSGKSLVLQHVLAECQRQGGTPVIIDPESTFNWEFSRTVGLDPAEMLYTKAYRKERKKTTIVQLNGESEDKVIDVVVSASIERVAKMIDDLIDLFYYDDPTKLRVIGLDSIAACTTEHEMDEPDKVDLTKAKGVRSFIRKIESKISDMPILVIITNHVIANIDMNPFKRKVGPRDKITPSGSGIPFGSSLRLELTRGSDIVDEKTKIVLGHEIHAFVPKNKVYFPRRRCVIEMRFDLGVDPMSGLLDILVGKEVVDDMGRGVYRYKGERFRRKAEKVGGKFVKGLDEVIAEYPEMLEGLGV